MRQHLAVLAALVCLCVAALTTPTQARAQVQADESVYRLELGAGIGGNLSIRYGIRIIWVSCGFLMISFLLMFVEKYKHFHEEHEHK